MLALLARLGAPVLSLFMPTPTEAQAKAVGGVILALALVLVLSVGKCTYDRHLIANHDAARSAQIANDTTEADRSADALAINRSSEFQASQDNISNAAAEARAADPVNAAKPVGPVSRSYYDTLPEKKK